MKTVKGTLKSFIRPLLSSKKIILLITVTAIITIIIGATIPIWSNITLPSHLPSAGTIRTLGVEAYWDRDLENKTEIIYWETIHPGLLRT